MTKAEATNESDPVKRTGYAIGDTVAIYAGSTSPMAHGTVIGYGQRKANPLAVRIKLSYGKSAETWPISCIKKCLKNALKS